MPTEGQAPVAGAAHIGSEGGNGIGQTRTSHIRRHAWRARDQLIAVGVACYRRDRDLPRLLPRFMISAREPLEQEQVIIALRQALLRERARGAAGAADYNLPRHMALAQAFRAEEAAARIK